MDPKSTVISNEAFARIAAPRLGPLLEAAEYMAAGCSLDQPTVPLTRPLLGRILSECAILEEFFDSFGAHRNCQFYIMRELIAAGSLFAAAGYKLLHIYHSLPRYHLEAVKGDFKSETSRALDFISTVLRKTMGLFAAQAWDLGVPDAATAIGEDFTEFEEIGTLIGDRSVPERNKKGTILELCTALLDLTASAESLGLAEAKSREEWREMIPDKVNEEKIRQLVQEFHHFKFLYDNGLSFSRLEKIDPDLPALRGHVSVVSHLAEAAVHLTHFYERHLQVFLTEEALANYHLISTDQLLDVIFGYLARYARWYSAIARQLSQNILAKYSRTGTISVPIPQYRGFHVRPSTMIAKIARHYGGDLTMQLLHETYDATQPLELFRANESVNAVKRMRLAEKLEVLDLPGEINDPAGSMEMVRGAVLKLAERRQLVIYEQPLPLEPNGRAAGKNVLAFAVEEVKKLLALGKIDLAFPIQASFTGDTRILDDIAILAENGYGEDRLGHNIPLPDKLSYLRKKSVISAATSAI